MLPTGSVYGGWPDSGEIDIMEHVGYDAGKFHGTVHSAAYNHMLGTQSGGRILAGLADWHIYEIDWSENKIDFILDGAKFHSFQRISSATFREWPFDQNFHLIFNIAVGGSWGGLQGINDTAFEGDGQVMEVDWVRVYSQ
jgi:beta-glucanase (GH16 family)